jgi:hypothetical protein
MITVTWFLIGFAGSNIIVERMYSKEECASMMRFMKETDTRENARYQCRTVVIFDKPAVNEDAPR